MNFQGARSQPDAAAVPHRAGIVVLLVIAPTIKLLGPVPPRAVFMSTGPEGATWGAGG
jgi:hypothetical protein